MSFFGKPADAHPTPAYTHPKSTYLPTFLLPSIAFRRRSRQSSTDSTTSTLRSSSEITLGVTPSGASPLPDLDPTSKYLNGHNSYLRCNRCSTDICFTSQIISKGFTGRHGRAYLVDGQPQPSRSTSGSSNSSISMCISSGGGGGVGGEGGERALTNTHQYKPVSRQLFTGQHTVSDTSCAVCGSVLGWRYVAAQRDNQRYKVGKFILETHKVRTYVDWEGSGGGGDDAYHYHSIARDKFSSPPLSSPAPADETAAAIEFDSQDEDECEDLFAGVWSPEAALKRRKGKRFVRGNNGDAASAGAGRRFFRRQGDE